MKAIILVGMFVCGIFSSAFAEEVVPGSYIPSTGIDQKVLNQIAAQGAAHKKAMSDIADLAKQSVDERNASNASIAEGLKVEAQAKGKVAEALNSYGSKIDAIGKNVQNSKEYTGKQADALGEQAENNAKIIGWGLAALIVVGVLVILARTRSEVREAVEVPLNTWKEQADKLPKEMQEAVKPVTEGMGATLSIVGNLRNEVADAKDEILAAIQSAKEEIPVETVKQMKTFDASPFEYEFTGGLKVSYQSPLEAIAKGYYLELHVPKDAVGDPATYERNPQSHRGIAEKNCGKTLRKYAAGDFNAPGYELQKALLEYLVQKDKSIKIKKIA
ncbi:MAG: hypothetical protein PHP62_04110 [Candidatus Moranbacteria bacterium]|nr:hypothetical protein [Candidatus Moranbacteria bacterium]